jgi:hypothetical protein
MYIGHLPSQKDSAWRRNLKWLFGFFFETDFGIPPDSLQPFREERLTTHRRLDATPVNAEIGDQKPPFV